MLSIEQVKLPENFWQNTISSKDTILKKNIENNLFSTKPLLGMLS